MGVLLTRFQQMVSRTFIVLVALCFIGQPLELLANTGGKHSTQTTVKTKSTHAKPGLKKEKKKSSKLSKKKKAGKAHGEKTAKKASAKKRASTAKKGPHGEKTGTFTAYTVSSKEGTADAKTADGTHLKKKSGCVVANNRLPLGTKIKVEGIGTCEVNDRLHRKKGGDRFDIYIKDDPKWAKKFGKKKLKYTVVSEPKEGQSG